MLTTIDVARLAREVVRAGIARVTGNLVVTGPLTYGRFYTTDRATRAVAQTMRRVGVRFKDVTNGGSGRGTNVSSPVLQSLRDILFYQKSTQTLRSEEDTAELQSPLQLLSPPL